MKFPKLLWIIFLLYIGVRLFFIYIFPPFTDESLYVRWGQLMIHEPSYRWISISQLSRQPLSFWLFGLGSFYFSDPVIGARVMVFILNIPVFFWIYSITVRLKNERAALVSVLLLALTPICIEMQSLALMDGLLFTITSCLLWILQIKWTDRKQWLYIPLIALLLAGSLWIKTTGVFIVICTYISLWIKWKRNGIKEYIWITLLVFILMLPLTLRPEMGKVLREPGSFMMTFTELRLFPVSMWMSNIMNTIVGFLLYLHPILLLLYLVHRKKIQQQLTPYTILWIALPLIVCIVLAKNFRFRYFMFSWPVIIPALGSTIYEYLLYSKKYIVYGIYLLIGMYTVFFIFYTPTFFSIFPTSSGERDYALSWPSGYGLHEIANRLDELSTTRSPFVIVLFDSPGNPTDYILARYYFNPTIRMILRQLSNKQEFSALLPLAHKISLFIVTRSTLIPSWMYSYIKEEYLIQKPYSTETIGIYTIKN